MKKSILSIVLLLASFAIIAQSQNDWVCRLGFDYEISWSPNWGKGKPVITSVYPYSSAEQSGLKVHDIIETIDGVPVTDLSTEEIAEKMNIAGKHEVLFTISNLAATDKKITVRKECKPANAITEDQLAVAFSMYSLESTSERTFICPFMTTVTPEPIDFAVFRTFTFSAIDHTNTLEQTINDCIEKELVKKGMTEDKVTPDLLIQTFYYFDKNPNYKGKNMVVVENEPVYRYDFTQRKMVKFPFLHHATSEAEAEYLLQLGFRFIDQKDIQGRILWECESNELLEKAFKLEEYARSHIPLMCMQYPYVKYSRNIPYKVNQKIYNYTGISYDIDRLEYVAEVDRNSPAYAAGVRPRDIIEKIDGHTMNRSAEEFSAAYREFISGTMQFRDPSTLFTDANGFKGCMLWDTSCYSQVADILQNSRSKSPFAYLYYYAPYVNATGTNASTFRIKRGKNNMELIIRPTVRTEMTVEIW